MFRFFRETRCRNAIVAALQSGGGAAFEPLRTLPPDRRNLVLRKVSDRLVSARKPELARVALRKAVEVDPEQAVSWKELARLELDLGSSRRARAAFLKCCELEPDDLDVLCELADLLLELGEAGTVVTLLSPVVERGSLRVPVCLGRALLETGHDREALTLAARARDALGERVKHALRGEEWGFWNKLHQEAQGLHNAAVSKVHGSERLVVEHGLRGELKARSGLNFRLLGLALIRKSRAVSSHRSLRSPAQAIADAQERLRRTPDDANAQALLANGWQRSGDLKRAEEQFRKACDGDPSCFAAFLGLGSVIDDVDHGRYKAALRLPEPRVTPDLKAVLVDWPALSPAEQRVVWASVAPLRRYLSVLAQEGATIRVLPLDVRATDTELFEDIGDERTDDDRSHDAIRGLASAEGAVVGVEELFDFFEGGEATFGHELAHVVLYHMDEADAARVKQLYGRAKKAGYVATSYASKNVQEFFAVSYAEYLAQLHGLPLPREADEDGVFEATMELFRSLGR